MLQLLQKLMLLQKLVLLLNLRDAPFFWLIIIIINDATITIGIDIYNGGRLKATAKERAANPNFSEAHGLSSNNF